MKTWKNKTAEKSSVATTVHFAQSEQKPDHDFGEWVECDELELDLSNFNFPLWRQGAVKYFGRL